MAAGRGLTNDRLPQRSFYNIVGIGHRQHATVADEQAALALLASRCLAGDAAAWEQLARTQHRKVYGICYRFTGSATEAEDQTQEVFLKMFRNLASFDATRGSFGTCWS